VWRWSIKRRVLVLELAEGGGGHLALIRVAGRTDAQAEFIEVGGAPWLKRWRRTRPARRGEKTSV